MTADSSSITAEWQQRLDRFDALNILFEADDQWGPLHEATVAAETSFRLIRTVREPEREHWTQTYHDDDGRREAELNRHMATIYDPLIEAGLALLRTPAPDMAAVRLKHEVCKGENGLRFIDYQDEDGELFDIIRADIQRLTGLEA
ncbi:MAG: hypothetical protein M3Q08_01675 [Pseudomonadota bacterium]|nr:hypothetical protein [Pseudomonadota bacterium]